MRHKELPVMTIKNVRDLYSLFRDDPLLPHTDEEVDRILKKKPSETNKTKTLIFPRNIKDGNRMTTAHWDKNSGSWIKSFKFFTIAGEKQEVDWSSVIPIKEE